VSARIAADDKPDDVMPPTPAQSPPRDPQLVASGLVRLCQGQGYS